MRKLTSFPSVTLVGLLFVLFSLAAVNSANAAAIGNMVFVDLDDDGVYEPVNLDYGVDGVDVELFLSGDDPETATAQATTTTGDGGLYCFDSLANGSYFVHLPKENFASGGALAGLVSSTGNGADAAGDDDVDEDGIDVVDPAATGINSVVHALSAGNESTGETGKVGCVVTAADNEADFTADFGLTSAVQQRLYVANFEADAAGNAMVAGTTDLSGGFQPYADLFASGVGLSFASVTATGAPNTANPLNLYDSEGNTNEDGDLERDDDNTGLWHAGNLTNDVLGNLLIMQEDGKPITAPNDNGTGGIIVMTSDVPLQELAFDFVDLDVGRVAASFIKFEDTVNGTETTVLWSDLEGASASVFSSEGAEYGDRYGNRQLDITAAELGLASFDKVTFSMDGSGGIGAIGVVPSGVAIGNLVYIDTDNSGTINGSEAGIDGVTVELFDTGADPNVDSPIATTVTASGGCYIFDDLDPGAYFVHIPLEEFAASGDLYGLISSTGNGGDDANDQGVDENGIDAAAPATTGVSSATYDLVAFNEPTTEISASKVCYTGLLGDSSVNLTADLGFTCPTITLTGTGLPNPIVGASYSEALGGSGGTSPYSFSTSDSLPAGLSLSSAGVISGTPTAEGSVTFTVTVTDDAGCIGSDSITLNPSCPIITVLPSSLPNGTVGVDYGTQTLTASGGNGGYTFTLTGGSLPAGLALNEPNIIGTPTSDTGGTFTITATDGFGCTGSREFTIDPVCPTITLASAPDPLPDGNIGDAYPGATISASGSTTTYTYALKSGSSLPAGMSIDSVGGITGTPTGPIGTTNFTVVATDANDCSGEALFTIGVGCTPLAISPSGALTNAVFGQSYTDVTFTATGGDGTITWTHGGTLPTGMSFNNATGVLSGTPTQAGNFSLNVTGTDEDNCAGTANLTLSVPISSIAGTTFEDTDGDGDADVVINATTIRLCNAAGDTAIDNPNIVGAQDYVIITTDGTYSFTNLAPGSYTVKQDQPSSFLTVTDGDTSTPGDDTANPSTTDNSIPVTLIADENDDGNDFVEIAPLALGNLVFNDADGDGIFKATAPESETGIDSVTVELWSVGLNGTIGGGDDVEILVGPDGALGTGDDASGGMVTASGGCYLFTGLPQGSYYVQIPTDQFTSGEALYGLQSSTGQGVNDTADDTVDENGDDDESDGVVSNVIALAVGSEATGEAGKSTTQVVDNDTNLTVDFGFTCPTITVTPNSLPDGTVGVEYDETLSASGGTGPYTFSFTGTLPAGVALVGDQLIGTPTVESTGNFSIVATDDSGCTGTSNSFEVEITCPTITLASTPDPLPDGNIGDAYPGATISASGSTTAYTYALKSGSSLPAGMSMDSVGGISGTPTGPVATTNFTVVATDVNGCTGEAIFTIGVDCTPLVITPSGALADAVFGQSYGSVAFGASGGVGAITWTQSGTLPTGMTFTTASGSLDGTPTEAGDFSFSVTGIDTNGCAGTTNLTISVPIASIAGTTFEDTDGDGDADVGSPINVTTISLCNAAGDTAIDNPNIVGTQDYVITTTDGTYSFINLAPGDYTVKQTQPTGFLTVTDGDTTTPGDDSPANSNTTDNSIPVTLVADENDDGNDFVEVVPLSIGNLVFCDDNNNSLYEPGTAIPEVGINGVTVQLLFDSDNDGDFTDGDATPIATQLTANDGSNDGAYRFDNLFSGSYRVVIPTSNFGSGGALEGKPLSSIGTAGGDDGVEDDDNGIQTASIGSFGAVESSTIVLAPGVEPFNTGTGNYDSTIDFGFIPPVGLGNLVFIDGDGDGIYDGGFSDTPAEKVTLELFSAAAGPGVGSALATTETDAAGCYQFTGLLPGDYIVHIPGAEFSSADDGDSFGTTGELNGYTSSAGHSGDDSSVDDDASYNENGIDSPDPVAEGISSAPIELVVGGESTSETGKDSAGDTPDASIDFTVDFSFVAGPLAGLGNLVFLDTNGDGDFDSATESGIDGVQLILFESIGGVPGAPAGFTTTQDGGCYYFSGLADGEYVVVIVGTQFEPGAALEGLESSAGNGGDDGIDDDGNENGIDFPEPLFFGVSSEPIDLAIGTEPSTSETGKDATSDDVADTNNDLSIDFGFTRLGFGLGNFVFLDNNNSGNFDGGDSPLSASVEVELYDAGDVPGTDAPRASRSTDASGFYVFGGLPAGDYFVHIPASEFGSGEPLEGLVSSSGSGADEAGDDNADENGIDSAGVTLSGVSSVVVTLDGTEPTETGISSTLDDSVEARFDLSVDFGFTAPTGVGIGNLVFCDVDLDGIFEPVDGDTGASGVVVELYAATAPPGSGSAIRSTLTASDGSYYFGNLADGDYIIHIPASEFAVGEPLENKVSAAGNGGDDGTDDDAGENGIDNVYPVDFGVSSGIVAVAAGTEGAESGSGGAGDDGDEANNDLSIDMGFVTAGVGIGNLVFRDVNGDGDFDSATEYGIDGVTVELYLASAGPGVGSAIATTETVDGGCYLFTGLADDSYTVHIPTAEFGSGGDLQFQTSSDGAGSDTTTDDGGDENGKPDAGGVSSNVFALALGNEPTDATTEDGKAASIDDGASDADYNLTADFGFTGKPSNFPQWQSDNAPVLGLNDAPFDNPDGDLYDNAIEFALCDHPASGVNEKPFCVELGSTSGTVDAIFTRANPAPFDLTYTLEVAPTIGSPPAWVDSNVTPTIVDNGDGSETVTYPNLEAQNASGIARLKVTFGGEEHYTPVFGWSTVSSQAECETVSNPYAPKEVFSGTVDSGSSVLDLTTSAGSADISAAMAARPHYIEIVSGDCAGHRFDVLSATADGITLDTSSARNTLDPIPDLSGEQITLRPHVVLDDVATAQDFVDTVTPSNNDNPATAGRVLFFDSVNGWSTYFAYNDSGALTPAIWTSADNSGLENVGNAVLSGDPDDMLVVIDPCAGFFVHSKAQAVDILMVGIVREWDFVCPLTVGYNFIGSGYPEDQSPNDRDMSDTYFLGTTDPATADQIEFWMSDGATSGVDAYDSHFRVDCGDYTHWTTQENSSLATEDAIEMFEIQRAAFINSRNGSDKSSKSSVWTWPTPWDPDAL